MSAPEDKQIVSSNCCQNKKLTSKKTKKKSSFKRRYKKKSSVTTQKTVKESGRTKSKESFPRVSFSKGKDAKLNLKRFKPSERNKRVEEKQGMMFTSSFDPYERPSKWWEPPHVKYAFAYSPVRSKLELLMGSNIVRLTDRKYMLKLMSRIRQDHESKQEARIQDRKMCELMRTKKMILNRFIPVQEAPEEIQRYPLFQLYLYCDAIGEQRRKKRVPKKVRMPKSLYRLLYPEKPTEEEGTPEEEDEESLKEALSDGGSEAEEEDLEGTEHVKVRKKRDHIDEADKEYMFTREEYENLHYEADAVKKLKETRTVNEMYKKAHEIVGILFNYTGGDKRRKMCEGQGND